MESWTNLTDRERLLVSVAGGLTLLVLVYFAVLRPLAGYVAESERSLNGARALYERVAAGAAAVKAASGQGATRDQVNSSTPLRVAVSRAARTAGVAISRIQPAENDGLTVWVESVPSQLLYRWVSELGTQHGIAPAKVIVQKSATDGRLRAQLQFEGRS